MKAILFDLDDTLIPERPAIEAGYAAVAERVWGASSGG
jgi:FMN phosphatase YigB (HAD superfamily)